MNIFINGRFLCQPVTGVQRYGSEVIKALNTQIEEGFIDKTQYAFTILVPHDFQEPWKVKDIAIKKVGMFSGHLWEQLELPFYARGGFLLNFCNTAPLLKRDQIVTIHDAAVFAMPQTYSWQFRMWYKILLTGLGKAAKKIMTVSSFSKMELQRYCRIAEDKISVVHEGKEHVFSWEAAPTIIAKNNAGKKPFVLAVSSQSASKNFSGIAAAIQLLAQQDGHFAVLIAGGSNPKVFKKNGEQLPAFVTHLGYVSDGELRALYEHASCFVYPSIYEGFGLPPIEAMACGCPVIVANAASLPEVCGDAALYCDPHRPEDIAEKILSVMTNASLRDDLRRRGLERVKHFTWEHCARAIWAETKIALEGRC